MKKIYVFATLLLMAGMAHAQYQNTITKGVYDLTSNVKSGLNVWKTLPGGGVCQPGSGSMSYGGHLYFCVGTDNFPYSYDRRTKAWTKRTDLGATGMTELAVKNANTIYGLWPSGHPWPEGNCPAPDQILLSWTSAKGGWTWTAATPKCLRHVSVGGDGFLAGITQEAGQQNILWYSQDNGKTWVQWESGYTYVHMWSQHSGCAVSTSGAVYTVSLDGSPGNMGGNFVGCMYGDQPFVLMAWDASGHVSMVDEQNGVWDVVSGLKASHIAGFNKYMVVALNQSNQPFHWNVKAPSITATASGTWTGGCPGPGSTCHPTTQHKATAKAWFSSGHGINYSKPATVWTVTWNQPINASFVDVNPGCDPMFNLATDVECQAESSGGEECLQSGVGIGNMPNPTDDTEELSHHYQTASVYTNRYGPALLFTSPNGTQTWYGAELLPLSNACAPDTFPTCPGPSVFGLDSMAIGGFGATTVQYYLDTFQSLNPFLSEEHWDTSGPGGTIQCLGDQVTWGTEGNFDDPTWAPQCD